MKSILMLVAVAAICALPLTANAGLAGLWEFEDAGNLLAASIGNDLGLTGGAVAVAGSGGPDTGAAQVGNGDYFTATNPIGANGGGANTNAYTLLMDFNSPGVAWNSLVDIDGSAFSSDGEVFTRNDGRIGIDGDYFDAGGVLAADGTWHRILMVFDMTSATPMTTYIDGNLAHAHTAAELGAANAVVDGRWSLLGTFNPFSDNGGGEEETLSVSNLALFDTALGANAAAALGGPGRPIIPEPGTFALAALVGLALSASSLRRRRD